MPSTKANIVFWTIIYAFLLVISKIICSFWVSPLAWGVNFGSYLPSWAIIAYAMISFGMILWIWFFNPDKIISTIAAFMDHNPKLFIGMILSGFVVFAYIFRIQAPLLGDSFVLINNYENTFNGGHDLSIVREPLAISFFYCMMWMLGDLVYPALASGFFYGELLLGAGFIIMTYFSVREIASESRERFLLFFFLLILPSTQLFFTYVEVYAVVLFTLSIFILSSLRYLNKKSSLILVCCSYSLLTMTHLLALIISPAMLYLFWLEIKRGKWKNVLVVSVIGILCCLILFIKGQGLINRILPPDDHAHYLSLFSINDGYQAYTLFSLFHITELLNLILLVCPFAILIIMCIAMIDPKSVLRSDQNMFFLLAAAGIGMFILTAKFDLALSKDWDVSTPWLFMVQLLLASLFLRLKVQGKMNAFFCIILVTSAHSLLWFSLNSTIQPEYERVKSLRDNRVFSREAYFLSTVHLSKYNHVNGNLKASVDLWEEFTRRFPDFAKGYSHLVAIYSDTPGEDPYAIDRAIDRWRELAPNDSSAKHSAVTFCTSLAKELIRVGSVNEGLNYYKKALSIDSKDPQQLSNIGSIFAQNGRNREALDMFLKAIEIDSNYEYAYLNLGIYYAKKADFGKSIVVFNEAISKDSTFMEAYKRLAIVYNLIGNKEKAEYISTISKRMAK